MAKIPRLALRTAVLALLGLATLNAIVVAHVEAQQFASESAKIDYVRNW
jgi:hypothetical protein